MILNVALKRSVLGIFENKTLQCKHMGAWMAIFQTRVIWPNSYYKSVLALKLFVGCVVAYFQLLLSLTKSPDTSDIC